MMSLGRSGNRGQTDSRAGDRWAGTDWQRQGVSGKFVESLFGNIMKGSPFFGLVK
jgi:hypothetical protein